MQLLALAHTIEQLFQLAENDKKVFTQTTEQRNLHNLQNNLLSYVLF